jgi:hypothetical protein
MRLDRPVFFSAGDVQMFKCLLHGVICGVTLGSSLPRASPAESACPVKPSWTSEALSILLDLLLDRVRGLHLLGRTG